MIFVSSEFAGSVISKTSESSYGSDHFLVTLDILIIFERCDSLIRLRLTKVNWTLFEEEIDQRFSDIGFLSDALERCSAHTATIVDCLKTAGTYVLRSGTRLSPIKPSWWSDDLELVTREKRG